MSDKTHGVILRIFAILMALEGLITMFGGLGGGGIFRALFLIAVGAFEICVAVGFWRCRGWAFLTVSVALLVSFMVFWIRLRIAFDRGTGIAANALFLVVVIALIGYLGRYRMERRFRPHLDARQPPTKGATKYLKTTIVRPAASTR